MIRTIQSIRDVVAPDDPRYCAHWQVGKGKFCGGEVEDGTGFCRKHSRKRANVYRTVAKETLADLYDRVDRGSGGDRLDLSGEIDTARVTAIKAVELWERACFGEKPGSDDAQITAAELVKQATSHVASLCSQQARVRSVSDSSLDLKQQSEIIDGISTVLQKVLVSEADRPDLYEKIMSSIDDIGVSSRGVVQITVS